MKTENGGRYYAEFMCFYFCNLCGELLRKGNFVREIGQKAEKSLLHCKKCYSANEYKTAKAQTQ